MGFTSNKREDVLSDVTFTISQGVVAALVEPCGSGKSTVARLAARFWDDALLACSELYGIPVLPGYHE